ncbi:MAG TPA: PRC-barrel domain-containing protein [Chthonomonadaceae bacterium]|nr:PRC-barrel domain-containing protein [Chthonomonadaceae bacterium]
MTIHGETASQASEPEELHRMLEGDDLAGLDAYSADGLPVGTVAGYLPEAPEDAQALEEVTVDPVDPEGEPTGLRHLLIDGRGLPAQARISVPVDQVKVDLRGRRVTLPMTMEQIRSLSPKGT